MAVIWLTVRAVNDETTTGITEILFYLWQNMAPVAVSSATFALVIVDGANTIMVLSEWLEETLEKRRRRQEQRWRQELRAAADKAAKEARKELQEEWLEWNRRREAAAAAGEQFAEPPPGTTTENE